MKKQLIILAFCLFLLSPLSATKIDWTYTANGPIRSAPAIADNQLFLADDSGTLTALNKNSSQKHWSFQMDAAAASKPALQNNLVAVTTKKGTLYIINQKDGSETWHFTSKGEPLYEGGWDYFTPAPLFAGENKILFPSSGGTLYLLDIKKKKTIWQFDTGAPLRATPAVTKKTVLCPTMKGELFALKLKNGKIRWKFKCKGNKYFPKGELLFQPVVSADMVFVGSRDASFYAVNIKTGKQSWSVTDKDGAWYTRAAVQGDTVYAASSDGHYVQALDTQTGKEKWKTMTTDLVFSTPLVSNGMVYAGGHDHYLYAFNAASGQPAWKHKLGGPVLGSPAVDGEKLYIGCDGGKLYAFNLSSTTPRLVHRKIYWDPGMDSKLKQYIPGDECKIATMLRDQGYEILNAAEIVPFLEKRGKDGEPSVIVQITPVYPHQVLLPTGEKEKKSPVRRYLDAGGTLISPILAPCRFTVSKEKPEPATPIKELMKVFSMPQPLAYRTYYYYDAYVSRPTEAGKELGFPQWWSSGYGVDVSLVTTVLGKDEHGRAVAWIKNYGGRKGTGIIRLFSGNEVPEDISFIHTIAENSLKR